MERMLRAAWAAEATRKVRMQSVVLTSQTYERMASTSTSTCIMHHHAPVTFHIIVRARIDSIVTGHKMTSHQFRMRIAVSHLHRAVCRGTEHL